LVEIPPSGVDMSFHPFPDSPFEPFPAMRVVTFCVVTILRLVSCTLSWWFSSECFFLIMSHFPTPRPCTLPQFLSSFVVLIRQHPQSQHVLILFFWLVFALKMSPCRPFALLLFFLIRLDPHTLQSRFCIMFSHGRLFILLRHLERLP